MPKFRKIPVEVDAVQWLGSNAAELNVFAGANFNTLDPEDRVNCDDPEATAQILDGLHSTWVLLRDGDFIVRGVQGEFYPVRLDVFEATYEEVPR